MPKLKQETVKIQVIGSKEEFRVLKSRLTLQGETVSSWFRKMMKEEITKPQPFRPSPQPNL